MSRARDLADGTFSGAFAADSPTLVVDDTNNRVGVGTASPNRLAELYGTSNPALRLNNGTNNVDIGIASSAGALLTGSSANDLVIARNGAYNIVLGTNGTVRARFDSDGLKFNGDTAAANALDDYEEGTWTPGIAGSSAGSRTMGSNNGGWYTKIGRQVHVAATIQVNGSETLTGLVMVTGLPFSALGGTIYRSGACFGSQTLCNLSGASKSLAAVVDPGQNFCWLMEQDDDTASYSHYPPIGSSGYIYGFSLVYETS